MTGVRVYTEDTGTDGIEVVRAIVHRTLLLLGRPLEIVPPIDSDHRAAGTLANWRAAGVGGHRARTLLLRATRTDVDLGRVVLFHVDADAPWSARGAPSTNVDDLNRLVLELADRRVRGMVPYAAIEAWLYRAYDRVIERIGGAHAEQERSQVDAWRTDPSQLEETLRPKDALPSIRSKHNLALAELLPTRMLHDLGLSYAVFARDLEEALASP